MKIMEGCSSFAIANKAWTIFSLHTSTHVNHEYKAATLSAYPSPRYLLTSRPALTLKNVALLSCATAYGEYSVGCHLPCVHRIYRILHSINLGNHCFPVARRTKEEDAPRWCSDAFKQLRRGQMRGNRDIMRLAMASTLQVAWLGAPRHRVVQS